MDSPLIPTPTLKTTTTCPIAILRMDPLTPRRTKRDFKMTVEVGSRDSTVQETRNHPKPLFPTIRRHARCWSRQPRFRTMTGLPVSRQIFTYSINSDHSVGDDLSRTGRVAIIRDVGAVTYVRYFLVLISSRTLLAIAVSRRRCISYTPARSPLPCLAQILVTNTLRKRGPGIGLWTDHHPHQQSRFTDSRSR